MITGVLFMNKGSFFSSSLLLLMPLMQQLKITFFQMSFCSLLSSAC